jgi:hypothetical protein
MPAAEPPPTSYSTPVLGGSHHADAAPLAPQQHGASLPSLLQRHSGSGSGLGSGGPLAPHHASVTSDMASLMGLAARQAEKEAELAAARAQVRVVAGAGARAVRSWAPCMCVCWVRAHATTAPQQPTPRRTTTGHQVAALESEVADLEKELALRDEMEAALKETLRELERAAARAQTASQQVRLVCVWGGGGQLERTARSTRTDGVTTVCVCVCWWCVVSGVCGHRGV